MMKMGYPHWVYCLNCGAKVHGRKYGEDGEKASAEAWNRRVMEPLQPWETLVAQAVLSQPEDGGGDEMNRMTQSFSVWCLKFHPEIYSLLRLGHNELLTEDMYQEYLDWVQTDEGKQYLEGGSKYREVTE